MFLFLLPAFFALTHLSADRLYIFDSLTSQIRVIDTTTDQEITAINTTQGRNPRFLKASPDGLNVVYIDSVYDNQVTGENLYFASIYNTLDNTLLKTVQLNNARISVDDLVFTANSQHALITDNENNRVLAITVKDTGQNVIDIAVDQGPDSVAVAPDGTFAYSVNSVNGVNESLSKINQSNLTDPTETISLAGFTNLGPIVITSDSQFALIGAVSVNNPTGPVIVRMQISNDPAVSEASLTKSGLLDTPISSLAVTSTSGVVNTLNGSVVFAAQFDTTTDFAEVSNIGVVASFTNIEDNTYLSVLPNQRLLVNLSDGVASNQIAFTELVNTANSTALDLGVPVFDFAITGDSSKVYASTDVANNSLKVIPIPAAGLPQPGNVTEINIGPPGGAGLMTMAIFSSDESEEVVETIFLDNRYVPNKFMRGIRRK